VSENLAHILGFHLKEYFFLPIVCLEIVNNFATAADPAVTNAFFQQYFLSILQDIFFVLTDTDHKSGFKLQSVVLARLYQLIELNVIQTPLFDPAQVSDPSMNNVAFLREYTANLLKNAFPHVQKCVFLLLVPFHFRSRLIVFLLYSILTAHKSKSS